MKVVVGSNNSAKIAAVRKAFLRMFKEEEVDVTGIEVDSGVASQPRGVSETSQGALNRARGALEREQDADFGVGLEAGLFEMERLIFTGGIVWVVSREGKSAFATTTMIAVREDIMKLVDAGQDLGVAVNQALGITNAHDLGGYFGIMTNQRLTRESVFTDACIAALAGLEGKNDFSRS